MPTQNVKVRINTAFGEIEVEGDVETIRQNIEQIGQLTNELTKSVSAIPQVMTQTVAVARGSMVEPVSIEAGMPMLNETSSMTDSIRELLATDWAVKNKGRTMKEIQEVLETNGIVRSTNSLSGALKLGVNKNWRRIKGVDGVYRYSKL